MGVHSKGETNMTRIGEMVVNGVTVATSRTTRTDEELIQAGFKKFQFISVILDEVGEGFLWCQNHESFLSVLKHWNVVTGDTYAEKLPLTESK
jgi:hypothetical protein